MKLIRRTLFQRYWALSFAALCLALNTASADTVGYLTACLFGHFDHLTVSLSKNLEDTVRTYKNQDGQRIQITLGSLLGKGIFGAVYDLLEVRNLETNEVLSRSTQDNPLVIKFPHTALFTPGEAPAFYTQRANFREYEDIYHHLSNNWESIQKHPAFPQSAPWKSERGIPTLPIHHAFHLKVTGPRIPMLETRDITLLVKPKFDSSEGKSLKELAEQYPDNNLPENIQRGLREIFSFVQAVYGSTQGYRLFKLGKKPFSIDLRPPNLLWIESPEALEKYGLSRPGFILFEIDSTPNQRTAYIETPIPVPLLFKPFATRSSFQDYLEEVKLYMNRLRRSGSLDSGG